MLSIEISHALERLTPESCCGMDMVLRSLHDELVGEFSCMSTELRLAKTPAGAPYPRTIQAFCTDSRAAAFGEPLESFEISCSTCEYLQHRPDREPFLEAGDLAAGE